MIDKVKQGKRNRAQGGAFELRVRKDLEEKGWIVDKWTNNVGIDDNYDCSKNLALYEQYKDAGKLIPAKRKYAGLGRPMAIGTGFPDFIALGQFGFIVDEKEWKVLEEYNKIIEKKDVGIMYEVIGVECKTNGYLDKQEKEKCRWLLDNNVFSKILIAEKTKVKNRIVILYHDFEEKYGK
jgi:hypothetical protein